MSDVSKATFWRSWSSDTTGPNSHSLTSCSDMFFWISSQNLSCTRKARMKNKSVIIMTEATTSTHGKLRPVVATYQLNVRRFLGPRMIYTSGVVLSPDTFESLETIQDNKLAIVCNKLDLKPTDRSARYRIAPISFYNYFFPAFWT
jgi:hypothetical protein